MHSNCMYCARHLLHVAYDRDFNTSVSSSDDDDRPEIKWKWTTSGGLDWDLLIEVPFLLQVYHRLHSSEQPVSISSLTVPWGNPCTHFSIVYAGHPLAFPGPLHFSFQCFTPIAIHSFSVLTLTFYYLSPLCFSLNINWWQSAVLYNSVLR